jgi:hypothetical protein
MMILLAPLERINRAKLIGVILIFLFQVANLRQDFGKAPGPFKPGSGRVATNGRLGFLGKGWGKG